MFGDAKKIMLAQATDLISICFIIDASQCNKSNVTTINTHFLQVDGIRRKLNILFKV